MINVSHYYNADKAYQDSIKANERLADQTFNANMETYRDEFGQMVAIIRHKVKKGLNGFQFLPRDESEYSKLIATDHIVPDDMKHFSSAQKVVFSLLRKLGYNVQVKTDELYFDGMTLADDPVVMEIASISWNGGFLHQKGEK